LCAAGGGAQHGGMRQLTFIKPRTFEWQDVTAPRLAADTDAIVRPDVVARCDLDLYIALGRVPWPGPFAFGHEAIGTVMAAGDKAGVVPGDRVIVPFQMSCGRCEACRKGYTSTCAAYPPRAAYGLKPSSGTEFGGAIAEAMHVPFADHMLVKVPDELDPLAIASISDNLPDGWRAVAPYLAERPGANVLVIGGLAQSVGLYAAGAAASLGADTLYLDDDPARRSLAQKMGCRAEPLAVKDRAPLKFEIVVDAMGDPEVLTFAILSTVPNGMFVSVAMYFTETTPLPLRAMYGRGITFHTSRVDARAQLPHVLAHCAAGHFHPAAVTTRVVPFSEAAEGALDPTPKVVWTNDWT
jgi:threonine dehydrogenase-like Zn-dependent dehydrogenase